ncbi:MAG: aldolase [Elusimicrobia bacterium]|nr:aldolase [Elusimicrobiota bacterium]MBK7545006.1 aldolase [Elusimicrobiota bacterium]MBK7574522.1 aldolase [Elusimicrobiota bacterium]MBK7688113.1 aldolase [Elusimicrobiota bacterium]MBK8126668.1 aldolase [Elusimicrobiota bacterium]
MGLKLLLITNDPTLAAFAVQQGVDRVFVDLEVLGKHERQGHRDTLISSHSLADAAKVRSALGGGELLVRLNPVHPGSEAEIDGAIAAGADLVMLPMFKTLAEVERVAHRIAGRCRFVPLVETPAALDLVPALTRTKGVDELYLGLNDLHMGLGRDFMFELLIDGTVERFADACRSAGTPFGFGGVARVDEGLVSGRLVLSEHARLGSSSVILSRTFHRSSQNLEDALANVDFGKEIARLREAERALSRRAPTEIDADRRALEKAVATVRDKIRAGAQR